MKPCTKDVDCKIVYILPDMKITSTIKIFKEVEKEVDDNEDTEKYWKDEQKTVGCFGIDI